MKIGITYKTNQQLEAEEKKAAEEKAAQERQQQPVITSLASYTINAFQASKEAKQKIEEKCWTRSGVVLASIPPLSWRRSGPRAAARSI